ncbi:39S ribosomal protein L16, mitochondrial [Habropoda laboriosa]|uniref:Large ribosomal subunit protein uL16m n=1 Tax=Habropoda laboriosa TaxID=597456 RepID=A0A0L7R6S9_9HYME|nr:PREDICTED: 39S ribosomal protein L16, mitochondrial [Habropoda laboriosa]KOC66461.1 39S ribosomal protein L16, mitochondrial [Habropoda laboriosa]
MQVCRNITKLFLTPHCVLKSAPVAGLQSFEPSPVFDDVEFPERNKLRIAPKVPQMPSQIRPYKMQKKLRLMRGPEEYHNTLLHKQYGIIATGGGRMKYCHFELIRLMLVRNVDYEKVFAIWRVPDPWQPITKKSAGSRMGRGKGSIDHYVTPVKAGQVIVEVGGKIEFFEVKRVLENLAKRMPFDAMAVSQSKLETMAENKRKLQEENLNPWTWKYIIQNNMLGCHKWISKYDRRWFNEYL